VEVAASLRCLGGVGSGSQPQFASGASAPLKTRRARESGTAPKRASSRNGSTVLVMPLETVEVLVQFDRYRGMFLLHCHNLQHEDLGMMLNVEVI
jgi:FtsP/CotA-like multicopper oxidase with cupredoxin domain